MTTSSQQTTSLKLDPEMRERVRRLAAARRRSAHWLMREAIAQYVAQEEQREQFRAEAEVAWAAFQADGLHVDAAEADAWMARLESGEDAEPPPPQR